MSMPTYTEKETGTQFVHLGNEFASAFKARREALDLSEEEVANRMNLVENRASYIRTKRDKIINLEIEQDSDWFTWRVESLLEVLGVSYDELIGLNNPRRYEAVLATRERYK